MRGVVVDYDVIVAGAGPAGLMLATELALQGVRVLVVERLAQRSGESKALNLQPRTAEVLELRGLLSRTNERALGRIEGSHFWGIPLRYDVLETRYPYQYGILQRYIEDVLEQRLAELGGDLLWGWTLTGFDQDGDGVTVSGPQTLRARYLVGCDGGHSTVRRLLEVPFPGTDASQFFTMADIVLDPGTELLPTAEPARTSMQMSRSRRNRPDGTFANIIPIDETGLYRLLYFDSAAKRTKVTAEQIIGAVKSFYGDAYQVREVRYAGRFGDASRQVDQYRVGRVFLAGDAAHIHLPAGGQGLNLSVQDAFNLGWKLAAVVTGRMPQTLLDTYHSERHPVGAAVLKNTRAQNALRTADLEHQALHEVLAELLDIPAANHTIASSVSGLAIDYGGPGPTGTRLPDFLTPSGWSSSLFHHGQGALLATRTQYLDQARPWTDLVVRAHVDTLPWPDVNAVLVRPDGYICWTAPGVSAIDALRRWFGTPASSDQ
jgi:2-polyprenyl-6-methoxyphenol hydroxylase-like FAD-dependent oxidoreductase